MSFEKLTEKSVKKIRKPHQCVWCGEIMKIGESAIYRSYKFWGDFHSDYLHPECNKAMLDSDDGLDEDGFTAGEYKRGSVDRKYE